MRRFKDLTDITPYRGYSQVRRTCCNKFIKMIMIMTSILYIFFLHLVVVFSIYLVLRWLDYFIYVFDRSHMFPDVTLHCDISFDLFRLFECLKKRYI